MRRVIVLATALCALACGDPADPVPTASKVTKVEVVGVDTLFYGESTKFTAVLTYDGDPPEVAPTVIWTSSDPTNVAVSVSGDVIPVYSGVGATITASAQGVLGAKTVYSVQTPVFKIIPAPAVMAAGMPKKFTLVQLIGPYVYVYQTINDATWSSSNSLTVSGAGLATASASGPATITATTSRYGRTFTVQSAVTAIPALHLQFRRVSGGPFVEAEMSSGGYSRIDRNCGLATDDGVYCWGLLAPGFTPNDGYLFSFSQGHYVSSQSSDIPIRIPVSERFSSVSMGEAGGGCALAVSGSIYCFGLNYSGQLGIPVKYNVTPSITTSAEIGIHRFLDHEVTRLPSSEPFRAIFAGGAQRCAIQRNDIAVCWGGGFGETPVPISTFAWNTIAERGTCGITADSSAYCWQFSGGKAQLYAIPLPHNLTHIAVSEGSACALSSSGELACWVPGTLSLSVIPNPPKLVSIATMPSTQGFRSRTCGPTAAGDLYCVVNSGTPPNFTNASFSLQSIDLGVRLKSFSGNCGIGIDDKAYCWKWNNANAVLVPGQP